VNRASFLACLLGAALIGVLAGEFVSRSPTCRDWIGQLCGRGHLVALAGDEGVYETDLDRAIDDSFYADGVAEIDQSVANDRRGAVLQKLMADAMAQSLSRHEKIPDAVIGQQFDLTRWQFRDELTWRTALRESGVTPRSLRASIAANLRERKWIEREIEQRLQVAPDASRKFYDAHPEKFWQPVRLRANHIFQAAPEATPAEIVNAKKAAIDSVAERLNDGESFADLAAEVSEDEANKKRVGDLNYFSATRMPEDFVAAAMNFRVDQISGPIKTRLGFHIIELTDFKLAGEMPFGQAEPEIVLALENARREQAVAQLAVDLARETQRGPGRP